MEGGALLLLLPGLGLLWLLRRPLRAAAGVVLRGCAGLGGLWLLGRLGAAAGVSLGLGVNLFNGLVLGVLGVPGFALLLLLRAVG